MILTEQIQIKRTKNLSYLCHLAKNLYNAANFHYRQFFFHLDEFLTYYDLQVIFKNSQVYKSLPAQTSQQVLRLVIKNWKAYWRTLQKFKQNPTKFMGRPKPPKYKQKNGESIVIFTNQNARLINGYIQFPKSTLLPPLKTRLDKFQQIRILPKGFYYVIEIVYKKQEVDLHLNKNRVIGIDLGINNLLTIVNNIGSRPIIIKGKVIKSMNQFYNKLRAKYRSQVNSKHPETRRMNRITQVRNNKIHDFFHKTSRAIIEYCAHHNIGTIIVGYNETWKQHCRMGYKTNQNFVSIPFLKLIKQLEYKGRLKGIHVVQTDENYTSKCSALDLESIQKHTHYLGKRVHRGLFRSQTGILINADVNGALNILRKVVPITFWGKGIAAVVLQPEIISV
jgi:putative transposase